MHAEHDHDISKLPIDVEATQQTYGYARPVSSIGPRSQLPVIIRCTVCGVQAPRKRRLVRLDSKCRHHESIHRHPLFAKHPAARRFNVPRSASRQKHELRTFVETLIGAAVAPTHKLPDGTLLDIYVPTHRIGIEYCGLKWHHELNACHTDRHCHALKMQRVRQAGVRLIQIFSDEWRTRRWAVQGFIKAVLGFSEKTVGARTCTVAEIDVKTAKTFMDREHVQGGSRRALKAWGLYTVYHEQPELIAAVTVARHHRHTSRRTLVLDRLCFRSGIRVPGGTGRLLKLIEQYATAEGYTEIVTWSDNRWSDGTVYQATGFAKDAELGPDYSYVELPDGYRRVSKQSQRKTAVKCPPEKTESAWARERGLARIWDAGKIRWVKRLQAKEDGTLSTS